MKQRKDTKADREIDTENVKTVLEELERIYLKKVLPIEEKYSFHLTKAAPMSAGEINSLPIVLFLGQYSTGKTTFIQHLLGGDYPGSHIGPEPTTDRFVAIVGGEESRQLPGNTPLTQKKSPFAGLSCFGSGFLSRFNISTLRNSLLERVILVDTPGILSGDKQSLCRSYNFDDVCKWFVERSDLIFILFDSHKLDLSDELKKLILSLEGYEEKVRIVLNKADTISVNELLRVYGALMWSLGRIVITPEVPRVYVVSLHNNLNLKSENIKLLQENQHEIMDALLQLPKNSASYKMAGMVKRINSLIVHVAVVKYLNERMPIFFGKKKQKEKLLNNMEMVFKEVAARETLAIGDFPSAEFFCSCVKDFSFSNFPNTSSKTILMLRSVLQDSIQALVEKYPEIHGPLIVQSKRINPFTGEKYKTARKTRGLEKDSFEYKKYVRLFNNEERDGYVTAERTKQIFKESELDSKVLSRIWELSDVQERGKLTLEEFCFGMHLLTLRLDGVEISETLTSLASDKPPG